MQYITTAFKNCFSCLFVPTTVIAKLVAYWHLTFILENEGCLKPLSFYKHYYLIKLYYRIRKLRKEN